MYQSQPIFYWKTQRLSRKASGNIKRFLSMWISSTQACLYYVWQLKEESLHVTESIRKTREKMALYYTKRERYIQLNDYRRYFLYKVVEEKNSGPSFKSSKSRIKYLAENYKRLQPQYESCQQWKYAWQICESDKKVGEKKWRRTYFVVMFS